MMTVIPEKAKEVLMAPPQYTPKDPVPQPCHPPPDFATQLQHAQAGCAACLERLMAQHDGLVHWTIHQGPYGLLTYTQALQAGRIGLWQALLHFDPTRGRAFSTYAWVAIRRHLLREVQREDRFWRPLPPLWPDLPPDPVEEALDHLAQGAVAPWVNQLRPRLRLLVHAYYGLDGGPPQDLPTLAQHWGCRKQRTHQLLHEALHFLALPAFSWTVRLYLGRTEAGELRAALRAWSRWRRQRWLRWRPYR
jgi:RNA polymerase sigma factor (sigma-70 family)